MTDDTTDNIASTEGRKFWLSIAPNINTKRHNIVQWGIDELNDTLTSHIPLKSKDGPCFIGGKLASEYSRGGKQVVQYSLMVFDLDKNVTWLDLEQILCNFGHKCWVYSTYSHKTTEALIAQTAYDTWAAKNGYGKAFDLDTLAAYLKSNGKDHLTGLKINDAARVVQTADGWFYKFSHDPVEKYRVVFPLASDIVLTEIGHDFKEASHAYEEIYRGIASAIGFTDYDKSCARVGQTAYMPSTPATGDVIPLTWQLDGPLLDYTKFERETFERERPQLSPEERARRLGNRAVTDKHGQFIDLIAWYQKHKFDWQAADVLRDALDKDDIRTPRSNGNGYSYKCAFEEDHSKPGGDGAWIANPEGTMPFVIGCSHDSCKNQHGRSTLDFVHRLIQDGVLTKSHLYHSTPDRNETVRITSNLGIDVATLPTYVSVKDEQSFTEGDGDNANGEPIEEESESFVEPSITFAQFRGQANAQEQIYGALKDAKSARDALDGFAELKQLVENIDEEFFAKRLAESQLSVTSIRTFARMAGKQHGLRLTPAEFVEIVVDIRNADPHVKIEDLTKLSQLSHESFIAECRRLAQYYGVSEAMIRAMYAPIQHERIKHKDEFIAQMFPEKRKLYAKVKLGKSLYILDKERTREDGELNIWGVLDFKQAFDTTREIIVNDDSKKSGVKLEKIKEVTFWMNNDKLIEQYHDVVMNPQPGTYGHYEPHRPFNLFQGWPAIPKANPKKGKLDLILHHLKHVFCQDDEVLYNKLILWFAHMLQVPWRKPHWCVLLVSSPGTGKSLIIEHLMKGVLGKGMWGKSTVEQLGSQFTKPYAFKLFVTVEEAMFSGDKKTMEVLKDRITSETIRLESKGVDGTLIPHYGRFIMTSNMDHVAHIAHNDRRFFILELAEDHKDPEYFKELAFACKDDPNTHLAFRNFLLNWKPEDHGLSWDMLYREAPMTEKKREQIELSLTPAGDFFHELLCHGKIERYNPHDTDVARISWALDEPETVSMAGLKALFESFLSTTGGGNRYFENKKYTAEFKRFIGDAPSNLSKTIRDNALGRVVRKIVLPPRRELLQRAYDEGLISKENLNFALKNPMSHLLDNTVDGKE